MPVEDLGTWPDIVGTGEGGSELGRVKDWNMDKGGAREKL